MFKSNCELYKAYLDNTLVIISTYLFKLPLPSPFHNKTVCVCVCVCAQACVGGKETVRAEVLLSGLSGVTGGCCRLQHNTKYRGHGGDSPASPAERERQGQDSKDAMSATWCRRALTAATPPGDTWQQEKHQGSPVSGKAQIKVKF